MLLALIVPMDSLLMVKKHDTSQFWPVDQPMQPKTKVYISESLVLETTLKANTLLPASHQVRQYL